MAYGYTRFMIPDASSLLIKRLKSKIQVRRWRAKHPLQARATNQLWREKNREKLRTYQKIWKQAHKERIKQYYLLNQLTIRKRQTQFKLLHPERCRRWWKNYRQKNSINIEYKLKSCLRARVRLALFHHSKNGSAIRDLGCTLSE